MADRFGNPNAIIRLYVPRSSNQGASISGLARGSVTIGNQRYRITVSGAGAKAKENQVGWAEIAKVQNRNQGGIGGGGGGGGNRGNFRREL